MDIQLWLWSLKLLHLSLNAAAQFLPPPGLPFPFPPQMLDGAPMPPMPPLPPMPLSMSPSQPQPLPLSMPMPMSMAMHQQRLPMMVMPYYSKNEKSHTKYRNKKKRRVPKRHLEDSSSDSDGSDSGSNDFDFRAKKHPKKARRQVLTPVVSYITKDGYVVYQKKIKKERAKDWLELGRKKEFVASREESGELLEDVKRKLRHAKKISRDD